MKKQKNYDKKVKNTRILLADWLLLKSIAQNAGVSMSQALHTIITRDWAMAQPHKIKTPVTTAHRVPTTAVRAIPTTAVRAIPTIAYRSGPITALATNGSKAAVFRIKSKGVRYD